MNEINANKAFKRDSQRVVFLLCVGFCGYGVMRKVGSSVGCPLTRRYITNEDLMKYYILGFNFESGYFEDIDEDVIQKKYSRFIVRRGHSNVQYENHLTLPFLRNDHDFSKVFFDEEKAKFVAEQINDAIRLTYDSDEEYESNPNVLRSLVYEHENFSDEYPEYFEDLFREFKVYRTNLSDLMFNGVKLAGVYCDDDKLVKQYNELSVYLTKSGKVICEKISKEYDIDGRVKSQAEIFDSIEKVTGYFGYDWLAKELYLDLGFDSCTWVE
ncbi:hypothetical protein [Vibrio metschnikovii]|uniref:hypothetical protein n=1 Tax=Vibrio metschnikovii TaxID=28172 RepID=UPI001C30B188|nr:DUF3265 domain-containing protein [Vibrio metschnikovii]